MSGVEAARGPAPSVEIEPPPAAANSARPPVGQFRPTPPNPTAEPVAADGYEPPHP